MNAAALDHNYTAGTYSVLIRPDWLKVSYDRLVLISHRRHIPSVADTGDNSLVLSTDWLAWRQCVEKGIACIHFESMLAEWPQERGNPDNVHMRNCNWMLVDSRDISEFHGISLGRLFTRDVSLGANAIERLYYALSRAIAQFQPKELVFLDMRSEHDLLDTKITFWIVQSLAKRYGVQVVDNRDIPRKGDRGFSEQVDEYGTSIPESTWRSLARKAYSEGIDWLFRLRASISGPRGRILLFLNWICARNIIDAYAGQGPLPAIFAPSSPKRLRDLVWLWRQNAILVNPPSGHLNQADLEKLKNIRSAISEQARKAINPVEVAKWMFIQASILDNQRLEARAKDLVSLEKLFKRHQFIRAVIGDVTNDYCRTIAETARQAGVMVDELINGMFLTRQHSSARMDIINDVRSCVARILSWGPLIERWIKASGVTSSSVTVGYPALDKLRLPATSRFLKRALVLPIYADGDDAMAFTSNIFGSLVCTVQALIGLGYEVRVKVHVGPQNFDYYKDVLQQAGLDVPIFKDNLFIKHLEWADFVVGPVNSGAFVETLAAGKPYYPVSPSPSQIDPTLLPNVRLIRSAPELISQLKNGEIPDRDIVLEDICRFVSIPDSSRCFWEIMAKEASA